MALKNDRYTYRVTWSEDDKEYVGLCAEFPSLSWLARTPETALKGIRKLVAEIVKDMDASGEKIPEPIACRPYSGKFMDLIAARVIEYTRTKNPHCQAMKTLQLILYQPQGNYDPINKISVEDILPRVYRFLEHYDDDGWEIFIEQLSDIYTSGSCSQGRVTRIFQFYSYHLLEEDEIYQKCLKKV